MEKPPEPAPAPDELQAGALWANNIARIAALAVDQKAVQGDAKDAQKKKAAKEAERAKEKEKSKASKPEDVQAATIVEELLKALSPPLLQFGKLFGSPSVSLLIIALLHLAFYFIAPFQLKFMMPYVMAYLVPSHCTLVSMYSRKARELWLSYWSVVAVVEYLEMAVFGSRYRILVWWPMIKLLGSVALYSIVKRDAKGKPIYGAVAIVTPFLPSAK